MALTPEELLFVRLRPLPVKALRSMREALIVGSINVGTWNDCLVSAPIDYAGKFSGAWPSDAPEIAAALFGGTVKEYSQVAQAFDNWAGKVYDAIGGGKLPKEAHERLIEIFDKLLIDSDASKRLGQNLQKQFYPTYVPKEWETEATQIELRAALDLLPA